MAGFIYVLSNPSMPGLVKIGKTTRHPADRAAELFTSGVPEKFRLEFAIYTHSPDQDELAVHERLSRSRVSAIREFFKMEVEDAIRHVSDEVLCEHGLGSAYADGIPDEGDVNWIADQLEIHPFSLMKLIKHVSIDEWKGAIALELSRIRRLMVEARDNG